MTTRMIAHGTFRVRKMKGRANGWPHDELCSAQAEAEKLAAMTPGVTFTILQEVARVTIPKEAQDAHS